MLFKKTRLGIMHTAAEETTGRKPTLTAKVTASLRAEIEEGSLKPGNKLPTLTTLTKKFGVSRTVIRESIAALKAEGLLEPRQGAGVYVLSPKKSMSSGQFFNFTHDQISDIFEILEIRIAVEVEAVKLACKRCTVAHQAKIYEALQDMIDQVNRGALAVEADYNFHLAIAEATNNRKFVEFLEFLGNKVISRAQLDSKPHDRENQAAYMNQILDEHQRIYRALIKQDAQGAKQAMRDHFSGSLNRHRQLIQD